MNTSFDHRLQITVYQSEIPMLLLKCLLMITGWGLLASAAAIALKNVNKVVQYHRRTRIHIALETGRPTRDLRA